MWIASPARTIACTSTPAASTLLLPRLHCKLRRRQRLATAFVAGTLWTLAAKRALEDPRQRLWLANQVLPKADLHQQAWQVHGQVQGSGSGIDVACSVHGGVITYQAGQSTAMEPVRFTTIYSGQSAGTASRVRAYQQWNVQSRNAFVRASESVVLEFQKDPVLALAAGCALLKAMAKQADLPYWTPAFEKIAALASDHGGAAKPSGAGGGDCAVAIFPDRDREEAFRQACDKEGWLIVPTRLSPGVRELAQGEA